MLFIYPPWVQLIRVNLRTALGVIFAHYASFSEKKIKHLKQKSNMACKQQKRIQRTQCKNKKPKNTKFLDKNSEMTKKTIKKKNKHKDTYLFAICTKKIKKTCNIEKYQNTIKLSKHIEE
ncbi:TPA: hypothetical protein SI477_003683 [Escherichia coli]|nr:hypothetical protein [Escherichia coli]HEI4017498.1 hypothetical protein [Escherichia coli]